MRSSFHFNQTTFWVAIAFLVSFGLGLMGVWLWQQPDRGVLSFWPNPFENQNSAKDAPKPTPIVIGDIFYWPPTVTSDPLVAPTIDTSSPEAWRSTTSGQPSSPSPQYTNRDSSYDMPVMVISYFPLTANGQNIDSSVTGDVGDPYSVILQRTRESTQHLVSGLTSATKYRGYKNASAQPALRYNVYKTFEHIQAAPICDKRRPCYDSILREHDICDAVVNHGVKEVWVWAYQGPTYPGSQYPYLNISESKMSGPFGDISNSYRENDMPQCGKTYIALIFNYGGGPASAMHSWGHQVENELRAVEPDPDWKQIYFVRQFQGPFHPQATNEVGHCGSVHNPPNASHEYDYRNPTPHPSDCLDWKAEGYGQETMVSCHTWGCDEVDGMINNPHWRYQIWNWQNLPGRNNQISRDGVLLRNWWDVHGDFDKVMGEQRTLLSEYY